MTLDGRAALVTGGAKRVGRAIVLELVRAGCDVVVHYRRDRQAAESLSALVASLGRRAVLATGELSNPATWPELIQLAVRAFGSLNILVNNASVFPRDVPMSEGEFDWAHWDQTLRTNLTAPVALCHYAREALALGGQGCIVNLTDIAADRPTPNYLAYGVSKAALTAWTKGLARAWAPAVRVNAVAPGIAVFPDDYPLELREHLIAKVPMARAGTPEDVAKAVRFLAESEYVTGQVIVVDGGRSAV